MKKSQKTFVKTLQGLLIFATLVAMIVLGIFLWNLISNTSNEEEPPVVNAEDAFEFSIVDYEYYKFEELDFNVLIATVHLKSNYSYNIPLSKLRTSENIYLNDVDAYLYDLQVAKFKPSNSTLDFTIIGSETELEKDFMLFIPVRSKDVNSVSLSSLVKPYSEMKFDLTDESKWKDKSILSIEDTSVSATDYIDAELLFKDYYIQSNFYTLDDNNRETTVEFPSNTRVLGVKLNLTNTNKDVSYKINSAKILYPTNQVVSTMNPDILLVYETNLLTETLDSSSQGVLFFLVPGDGQDILEFSKSELTLVLELSNGESVSFTELIGN